MRFPTKVFTLALIYLFIFSGALLGQKISLKNVQLNLSLQDYRIEDIIDGTPDEDYIGYVHTGLVSSSLRKVYFDDSVTEEFERLFEPVFSKSDDAIPLTIRINSIQVNEWTAFLETKINLVSLSLSIFQGTTDGKYVQIADRVINDMKSHGVRNEDIAGRIGQTVDRAFDFLDLIVDSNKPSISWSELWEYEPYQDLPYPQLERGLRLFEHYSDFRQNRPLDNLSIKLNGDRKPKLTDEGNNHPIALWGYTSEGQLFINIGTRFIPLESANNGFTVSKITGAGRDLLDGVKVNLAFRKTLGVPTTVSSFYKDETSLSSLTGFIDIKSINDQKAFKDRDVLGEKTIIEFAPFGHADDILELKTGGLQMIQLSKGEFFQIPDRLKSTELQACVNGRCETIILDKTPMHRVIFKKGSLSQEPFTEKERMRYLRNVDLKYWVMF